MKVISGKTERRLRNVLITLAIICMTPLCENGRMLNGAHQANAFEGEDIRCVIDLGDEMYAGHGLETGMSYELLNRFAEDNRCNINIIIPQKGDNYLDSLKQGKIDVRVQQYIFGVITLFVYYAKDLLCNLVLQIVY